MKATYIPFWSPKRLIVLAFIAPAAPCLADSGSGVLTTFTPTQMYFSPQGAAATTGVWLQPESIEGPRAKSDGPFDSTIVFLQRESARLRPTIFEDMASAALWASETWWKSDNIERRYNNALIQYSIRNGNFATSEDSPNSAAPRSYRSAEEAAFRHEMAASLKRYMIAKGIPQFLKSYEPTRELGVKYESVQHKVATYATIQVVTENKWNFKSGFNPIRMLGWVSYSNTQWNFEMDSYVKRLETDIFAQRSFKRGYSSEIRLKVNSLLLLSSVSRAFNPHLKGSVGHHLPLKDSSRMAQDMSTHVGLDYSF